MKEKNIESVSEKNSNKKSYVKVDRRFYGIPYPTIYLHTIRLSCPFCNKRGRSKIFKNLWQLRMHFSSSHTDDQFTQDCKNIVGDIVEHIRAEQALTEMGVLR